MYLDEVKNLRKKLTTRRGAGEYAKCAFIGEKLLSLHKKHKNTQSMNFADDIFNLATIYEEMGRLERAKTLYSESLRLTEAHLGQGPEYSERITNLGLLLSKMGKSAAALGMLTKAEIIMREKYGTGSAELAAALQNTANCMQDIGQMKPALEKHMQALLIRSGNKDLVYADNLHSLGECFEALKENDKAGDYFLESLEVTAEVCGKESEEYLASLINYSDFLMDMGRMDLARKNYNKALKSYEKLYAGSPEKLSAAMSQMADKYESLGDNGKSLLLKYRALGLIEKSIGGFHMHFANLYRDLAQGLSAFGDKAAAIKSIRKSLKIKEALTGRLNDGYVRDLLTLCLLFLEQYDYKRLAATLKSALKGIDLNGPETPAYYKSLSELHFLTSELYKLSEKTGNPDLTGESFSGDLKRIEALCALFKIVSDNFEGA